MLAAFALRLYELDTVPLRGDEAYSVVHWTAAPFSDDWWTLWRAEPAPVGAFILYWLWDGMAGDSPFAFRYLSMLGNVIGLAVLVALARRLTGSARLALVAGVLWAVHPYLVWYAQDARIYGVLSALSPLAFYWLVRAVDAYRTGGGQAQSRFWRVWAPYIIFQTLALYLYFLEPFWLAAQGVYVLALALLVHPARAGLLRGAVQAWAAILILIVPVLLQLHAVIVGSGYQGNAESASLTLLFSEFVPTLLFGENTWPVWAGLLTAVLIVAGLVAASRTTGDDRRPVWLVSAWVGVPLLLLVGASLVSDFLRPRYVQTVIPGLLLALVLIGAWAARVLPQALRDQPVLRSLMRALPLTAAAAFIMISLVEVNDYFTVDPPKAPDWPGLMTYLEARSTPQTAVITGQPDPAQEYYFDGPGTLVILPLDWYETDWQSELSAILRAHDTVFLLASDRTGPAAAYLQSEAQPIPGDTYPGVAQFRLWPVDPAEIAQPVDARFGDVAVLRGYTLLADTTLLLYWEALAVTAADHSVLLHLEPASGGPVVVLDHAPAGGVISTRIWQPGTLYRDPVALPVDLAPGVYTLRVGLYPANQPGDGIPAADGETRYPVDQITLTGS
ncbi:MAG: glycosyltransferase family 39 protein [Chloroflexota bacterium]